MRGMEPRPGRACAAEVVGVVTAIVAPGRAAVRVERSDACGKCRACIRIGPSSLTSVAADPLGVHVGDRVAVAMPEGALAAGAALMFLFPLLAAFAGAALGWLAGGEAHPWGGGVGAGVGLAAAIAVVRRFEHRHRTRFEPVITRVIGD